MKAELYFASATATRHSGQASCTIVLSATELHSACLCMHAIVNDEIHVEPEECVGAWLRARCCAAQRLALGVDIPYTSTPSAQVACAENTGIDHFSMLAAHLSGQGPLAALSASESGSLYLQWPSNRLSSRLVVVKCPAIRAISDSACIVAGRDVEHVYANLKAVSQLQPPEL